ncbi:hypothetical protein [uncultured Limosilactobacillus sp.]|uniref:hypothetical protein n=1 Tax=uncultured Limosilactobacillus sp. TaxID=2837629 RepID=UPI0025E39C62|nr:hypothetical protein [uncultured Limosilactobacillus sp.]
MSKRVFGWDADGLLNFWDVVPDDYQLQSNQTFDDPTTAGGNGARLLNRLVKRVAGNWQPLTDEELAAYQAAQQKLRPKINVQPQGPSAEQQMINLLGKTQMTQSGKIDANTADIKQVKQMINFIGKQQMASNKENGGN